MEKICYTWKFCKRKQSDKGEIALELSQSKTRQRLHTGIFIKSSQWNSQKQQVVKHPLAREYNYYLMQQQLTLEKQEIEQWRAGKDPCIKDLLIEKENTPTLSESFVRLARQLTNDSNWKDSTRRNRLVSLGYWQRIIGDKSLRDIDLKDVRQYVGFLSKEQGLSPNTVAKHLRHMKIYANMIRKEIPEAGECLPFDKMKIKTQNVQRPHLSFSQLQGLEEYSKENQDLILDAFLFCVYSGLRYSDFIALQASDIHWDAQTNACWLGLRMKKTGRYLRLPLHLLFEGKSLIILRKYRDNLANLFSIPSNTIVNRHLKKIALVCNIQQGFSFHVARHTFATHLLQKGVQVTVIQQLLGHSNLRTTMTYAAVTEENILAELARVYP